MSAGNDPLRDDAVRYATRLEEAGVPVEHLSYGGTIHSFMLYAGVLQAGMEGPAPWGSRFADCYKRHEIRLEKRARL